MPLKKKKDPKAHDMRERSKKITEKPKFKMQPDTYYVWIGASCDYAHEERCSAGAYIMEQNNQKIDTYVVADDHTTEFRMMLTVMLHAMEVLPVNATIIFLTNVAYIQQNWDRQPTSESANSDLILRCISAKRRHESATVKVVSYHKFPQLPETHRMAHEAMEQHRRVSHLSPSGYDMHQLPERLKTSEKHSL